MSIGGYCPFSTLQFQMSITEITKMSSNITTTCECSEQSTFDPFIYSHLIYM